MNSLKATKYFQYNDKKLGQEKNQRFGTRLVQPNPIFYLLIGVVTDTFSKFNIIFSTFNSFCMLNLSKSNVGKKLNELERFFYKDTATMLHHTKFTFLIVALSSH